MDRGCPLQRRTPLNSGAGLQRRTQLAGSGLKRQPNPAAVNGTGATSKPRPAYRPPAGFPRAVVDAALDRCQCSCEVCGAGLGPVRGVDWSTQHRLPRGMGGTSLAVVNGITNLLVVCGSATTGCHGWIETHRVDAGHAGWLLTHPQDPAAEPVLVVVGDTRRWVLLTTDGGYADAPASGAGEAA